MCANTQKIATYSGIQRGTAKKEQWVGVSDLTDGRALHGGEKKRRKTKVNCAATAANGEMEVPDSLRSAGRGRSSVSKSVTEEIEIGW